MVKRALFLTLALGSLDAGDARGTELASVDAAPESMHAISMVGTHESPLRPWRIDDQFHNEKFEAFTYSPNGVSLAFVRSRPAANQLTNDLLSEHVRDDVWLQRSPTEAAENLTNGASDASGFWQPIWSADGARLMMLSSRGGTVSLWGWEKATDVLRKVSSAAIDAYYQSSGSQVCQWTDADHILCVTTADGVALPPLGQGSYFAGRYVAQAEAAWSKAKRGEVTASEVSSTAFPVPIRRLTLIDFRDGTTRPVAETQADPWIRRWERTYWLSPRGVVAFIRPDFVSGYSEVIRRFMGWPGDLGLARLDGTPLALKGALPHNIVTTSVQWSRDGRELAFFALEDRALHPELLYGEAADSVQYPKVSSKEYPGRLFRVNVVTGEVRSVALDGLDIGSKRTPPNFFWLGTGELALYAGRAQGAAGRGQTVVHQWLVLQNSGGTRPLMRDAPPKDDRLVSWREDSNGSGIVEVDHGRSILTTAAGELWRVDLKNGKRTVLTQTQGAVLLAETGDLTGQSPYVLLRLDPKKSTRARGDDSTHARHAVLDVRTGERRDLASPDGTVRVAAIAPDGKSVMLETASRRGSAVWRVPSSGPSSRIAVANEFWQKIAPPVERIIEYVGMNGEPQKAKLLLPPGYESTRRYPTVVLGRPGMSSQAFPAYFARSATESAVFRLESDFDQYSFASAGYLVLFASMPTRTPNDPHKDGSVLDFAQQLVPALEAAVTQGYADPKRTFLYGFSKMANAVYSTVTQTSRFSAAVGAFGWVDNTEKQLALDMRRRYSETPFVAGYFGGDAAYMDGEIRSWRDGDLLRRYSALSYVDRVNTPLMMIDSDFDEGWLENSEKFFSALVQQRKPAKFVRYWGESHGLHTPANVQDYFCRIFAWLDEWGDISRDADGRMNFENGPPALAPQKAGGRPESADTAGALAASPGQRVSSRNGAPPLKPDAYAHFQVFSPGGETAH